MRNLARVLPIAILIFAVVATTAAQDETARVRIGHLALDAEPIDIYLDGVLEFESFVYPDLTTWIEVTPGIVQVTLVEAGEPLETPLLPPVDLDLEADEWNTVALIGESNADTLETHILEEDFSELAPNITRITVFHAIPRSGAIDLYANGDLLAGGLTYPGTFEDNDGLATIDIAAGSYDLQLTSTLSQNDVYFSTSSVLGGNRHYFVAGIGRAGNPNGRFVTTNLADFDDSIIEEETEQAVEIGEGNAFLRVGHFAQGGGPLDLYLDGLPSDIQNVSYVGLTDWVSLPVGIYEATFAPQFTSVNQAVMPSFDVILVEDTWNTIALVEEVDSDQMIGRVIAEDYSPLDENQSRITFFHAVPDAPALDIIINTESAGALEFPGSSPSSSNGSAVVTLDAGAYDISFVEEGATDTQSPVFALPTGTQLAPGNHYFIGLRDNLENINFYVQPINQDSVIASFE